MKAQRKPPRRKGSKSKARDVDVDMVCGFVVVEARPRRSAVASARRGELGHFPRLTVPFQLLIRRGPAGWGSQRCKCGESFCGSTQ